MSTESRSTRDIVISVETEVKDLKCHFKDHLDYHADKKKEDRKRSLALILVTFAAVLTAIFSFLKDVLMNHWNH